MFQHFGAQDYVKRNIGYRNGNNVGDDVDPRGVPGASLQRRAVANAFVLAEVLRHVVEMGAVGLEPQLSCPCVEDAAARRDRPKSLGNPSDTSLVAVGTGEWHGESCRSSWKKWSQFDGAAVITEASSKPMREKVVCSRRVHVSRASAWA